MLLSRKLRYAVVVGLAGALASWGFGCGGDVPSDAANRGNLGAFNSSTSAASTDQTGTGGMAGGTGGLVAYSAPDVSQSSTGGLDTTMATGGVPDAPDGETTCGGVEVTPMVETVVIPGNVLVVFDESLSMNEQWGNGQTKWVAASQAVISALTPLQDQISAGTLFFPTGGGFLGCDVAAIKSSPQIDFMPGPQFITAWNSYMASHGPSGMTPTGTAMAMADAALAGAALTGNIAVIVITDGDPNCGTNDTQVNQFAANWLANGIQTHVIGLPGASGGENRLNALAAAGGTGQYLVPTDATALQSVLANIASNAVSTATDYCNITLPQPPPNPDDVTLTVVENGVQQAVAKDLGTGGGWTMDTTNWQISLFGNLCDQAMAGNYEKISAVFGCISLPPLPPPEPPVLE